MKGRGTLTMPSKRTQRLTTLRERMEAIHKTDRSARQLNSTQPRSRSLKSKDQQQWQSPRSKKKRIQKKWLKRVQQSQAKLVSDTTGITNL